MNTIEGIIHDINNKLTISRCVTKKLGSTLGGDNKDFQKLTLALNSCRDLVKQLRNVNSSQDLEQSSLENFYEESENEKKLLHDLSELHDLDIDYHFDIQPYCWLESSSNHSKRVITNCIENAKNANATRVLVEFHQADSFLLINIKDNGEGMSEEVLSKIGFGFSTQCGDTHGRGTQVIRELVNEMSGNVRWSSIKGLGTCCSIKLKLAIDPNLKIEEQGNLFEIKTPNKIYII